MARWAIDAMSQDEREAALRSGRQVPSRPPLLDSDGVALFLDIDGTLLDLAATPDGVYVDHAVTALLPALARRLSGALALITGRAIAGADDLFPGLHLPIAGLHGLVRRAADGSLHSHPPPAGIEPLRADMAGFAARHRGVLLEDKGVTLALHYRQAPRLAPQVYRFMRERLAGLRGAWYLQPGKGILEIRPSGGDKGTAVRDYMAEEPFAGRLPVFVGDDRTDEHGFAAAAALGGWGVKVGRGSTQARYRLPQVAAVRAWLGDVVASP